MTFEVELMLRQDPRVFSETIHHETEILNWSEADADAVVRKILRAAERVIEPGSAGDRPVGLRGVSWIVSPHEKGVVLAIEIHSASIVAGPFEIPQADLERLLTRVVQAAQPRMVVH
jgi:hypothetical protein